MAKPVASARGSFVKGQRPGALRRAPGAVADVLHVEIQFGNRAAECVAVHAQLARRLALIALVFLQHRKYEAFLELPNRLGVEYPALVHLCYQGFQLVFHSASLLTFA
jgi:hypothetical protein